MATTSRTAEPRHGIQEDDDPGDTSTHDSNSSYSSLEESYSDTLSGQDMLSENPKTNANTSGALYSRT